jgi:hypothetical protein
MSHGHKAIGRRQQWVGIIGLLAVLLFASAVPGYAWRGRHGFGGHGFHRFHRFGGPHIGIGIGIGPFWGPYWGWGPYWAPYHYPYPPAVVQPAPPVYVQLSPPVSTPPPPQYWYAWDNPKGYYPYVQQCSGGWRPVAPSAQ